MEGVTAVTLSTVIDNAKDLASGVEDFYSTFSDHWFFFLPMSLTVFSFLLGSLKGSMFFRKRRRGR